MLAQRRLVGLSGSQASSPVGAVVIFVLSLAPMVVVA